MHLLANPKGSMWLCRLIPMVTWLLWLVEILSDDTSRDGLSAMDVFFFASLVVYLPLLYFVLPVFLFKEFQAR
jgi:hypothetical protein